MTLLHLDTGKPHPSAAVSVLVQTLTAKRTEGWSLATLVMAVSRGVVPELYCGL